MPRFVGPARNRRAFNPGRSVAASLEMIMMNPPQSREKKRVENRRAPLKRRFYISQQQHHHCPLGATLAIFIGERNKKGNNENKMPLRCQKYIDDRARVFSSLSCERQHPLVTLKNHNSARKRVYLKTSHREKAASDVRALSAPRRKIPPPPT